MNRRVKIGLVVCLVLAAVVLWRVAGWGGRSPQRRVERPRSLLVRCADSGRVMEMPFEQVQQIADQLRGDNPEARPVDIPICPATGKPYRQVIFTHCPQSGKLFAIAFGKVPDKPIDADFIRRMSPYVEEGAGPTGQVGPTGR